LNAERSSRGGQGSRECVVVLKGIHRMKKLLLVVLVPLSLGGCLSFHESAPPPKNTTIVVPPGSTVTCSNGLAPPC
jgi:hypothetical protein